MKNLYLFLALLIALCITLLSCKDKDNSDSTNKGSYSEKSINEEKETKSLSEEDIIENAIQYTQSKQYDKAITLIENFLKDGNPTFLSYYYLSEIYFNKGDYEKAKEHILKVIELQKKRIKDNPDWKKDTELVNDVAEAHSHYAIISFQLKDYDTAEKEYTKTLKLLPEDPGAHGNFATFYFQRKQYDKAINLFEKALKFNPEHRFNLYGLANTYMAANKLNKAVDSFQKVITLYPEYAEAYRAIGKLYEKMKEPDLSHEFYGRASYLRGKYQQTIDHLSKIKNIETQSEPLKLLIASHIHLHNFDKAMKLVNSGRKRYPDDVEYIYNEFQVYYQQQELDKAISVLENALKDKPNSHLLISSMAVLLRSMNKLDEAIEYFNRALKLEERDIRGREALAQIYREQGKRGLEHFHQGIVYYYKRKYKEASDVLNFDTLKDFKQKDILQRYRGLAAVKLNQDKQAEQYFLSSIQQNKDYYPAYIDLAKLYVKQGKKKRAAEKLRSYLDKSKDNTGKKEVNEYLSKIK